MLLRFVRRGCLSLPKRLDRRSLFRLCTTHADRARFRSQFRAVRRGFRAAIRRADEIVADLSRLRAVHRSEIFAILHGRTILFKRNNSYDRANSCERCAHRFPTTETRIRQRLRERDKRAKINETTWPRSISTARRIALDFASRSCPLVLFLFRENKRNNRNFMW